jgi:hypothetical protein
MKSHRIIPVFYVLRRIFTGKEIHHHPFLDVVGLPVSVNVDEEFLL